MGRFRWFSFVSKLLILLLTNHFPRSVTMRSSMTKFTTPIALNRLSIILKMFLLSVTLMSITLLMISSPTSKQSLTMTSVSIIMISKLSSRLLLFLCKTQSLNIGIGKRFLLPRGFLSFCNFFYKYIKCHGF